MGKASKIEMCMFCGTAPCSCNAEPKKAAPKKRKPKAEKPMPDPAPVAAPKPALPAGPDLSQYRSVDKSAADSKVFAPVIPEEPKPQLVVKVEKKEDPNADLKKAIRNLIDANILDPQERAKFERHVREPVDTETMIKVNQWKERNRGKN